MIKLYMKDSAIHNQRGAAMLLFVLFFLFASASFGYLLSKGVTSDLRSQRVLERSKQSYLTSLSANEDILYRYKNGLTPDSVEAISLAGSTAVSTTTLDASTGNYIVSTAADNVKSRRASKMTLSVIPGIAFNFGMQSGTGGVTLQNTASVVGNLYSNGPVVGVNATIVKGDATSAGPSGSFSGLQATGTVRAHSILSSPSIGKDAYYQTINAGATTVLGTKYPGATDMATATLPISDSEVADFETAAAAGGTYSGACPYVVNTSISLGPIKIPCDLTFSTPNKTLTINGPIWVKGNLTVDKGTIQVGASLANKIVPIIVDNTSDQVGSSLIDVGNGMSFTSATGNSYTMLLSMNKSGETGGSNTAINIKNSSAGEVILYTGHGILVIQNNTLLRQATAWKIVAQNSSQVRYNTGLLNPSFTNGPAGTFTVANWKEI